MREGRSGQILPLRPRTHLLGRNNFYPELVLMQLCLLVHWYLYYIRKRFFQIILHLNLLERNRWGSDSLIRLVSGEYDIYILREVSLCILG